MSARRRLQRKQAAKDERRHREDAKDAFREALTEYNKQARAIKFARGFRATHRNPIPRQ